MAPDDNPRWQVWVDTGGTFTDCLARSPEGALHRAKVLSSSALRGDVEEQIGPARLRVRTAWGAPADFVRGFRFRLLAEDSDAVTVAGYDPHAGILELGAPIREKAAPGAAFEVRSDEEAPILAARLVTGTPSDAPLPPLAMRLATTRGTNALLERRGAPVALFVTEGFGDLLEIGTQQRPDLFALDIRKPPPLYQAVVEVPERIAADGHMLRPLDTERIAADIDRLLASGVTAAAVALLHGDRHPGHERALAAALRRAGFAHVSCASDLAPFIKLLPRAQTAVVNAYLAPLIDRYVEGVQSALTPGPSPLPPAVAGGEGRVFAPRDDQRGRAGAGGHVPGQRQPPVRSRGRDRGSRARGSPLRFPPRDRVRHGRDEHGCRALRR